MALVKWKNKDLYDPWNGLRTLQDEINELFDIDRSPATPGLFDRNLSPAMDVIEGEENFTVRCELPGIELKDMDLTVFQIFLPLRGRKNRDLTKSRPHSLKRNAGQVHFRELSLFLIQQIQKKSVQNLKMEF